MALEPDTFWQALPVIFADSTSGLDCGVGVGGGNDPVPYPETKPSRLSTTFTSGSPARKRRKFPMKTSAATGS